MSLVIKRNESIVVDASILAKHFLPQEDSSAINTLIPEDTDEIAPSIIDFEMASLLCKHQRLGNLSPARANEAFHAWERYKEYEFVFLCPRIDYLAEAFKLSCLIKHSFYDCCYLALASLRGCCLVTADRQLYERGKSVYSNIKLLA
jgi:predicted nucleic acid-binding protein